MGLKKFAKAAVGAASGTAGLGTALGFAGGAADFLGNKSLQNDAQSFTKWMSRNKYQSAVYDLEKAGLNPILAVSGLSGGAGGSAGGMNAFRSQMPQAISSAVQLRRVNAEIKNLEAQALKTGHEAQINEVGATIAEKMLDQLGSPFSSAIEAAKQGYTDIGRFVQRLPQAAADAKTIATDKIRSKVKGAQHKYWDWKDKRNRTKFKGKHKKPPIIIRRGTRP